jgi:hypothetical protein
LGVQHVHVLIPDSVSTEQASLLQCHLGVSPPVSCRLPTVPQAHGASRQAPAWALAGVDPPCVCWAVGACSQNSLLGCLRKCSLREPAYPHPKASPTAAPFDHSGLPQPSRATGFTRDLAGTLPIFPAPARRAPASDLGSCVCRALATARRAASHTRGHLLHDGRAALQRLHAGDLLQLEAEAGAAHAGL